MLAMRIWVLAMDTVSLMWQGSACVLLGNAWWASPHSQGAQVGCRGSGLLLVCLWGPPRPGADTLIPAFRREMCGPGHRRPAAFL